MIFEHGARMGAPGLIMLPEVGPGEVHTVLVQMQIPKSTGRHVATWTVRTSWGHCFSVVPFAVTAVHQDEELSGAIETIRAMGFTDISDHDLVQLLISHGMQITDDLVNALASD
jgi:sirohydrochlorin ferrochelatase